MAENATPTRRTALYIVALVVVIAAAFGIRAMTRTRLDVHIVAATRADMTNIVSTNGIVEPVEDFQAHASAPGTVQHLYVADGDHVAQGAMLVRLEDSDARSRVAAARASLEVAQVNLANLRQGGTADEALSSANDLASARNQVTDATAALHASEELLARGSASSNEVAINRQKLADAQTRVAQLQARRTGRYSAGDVAAQQAQVEQARAAYIAAANAVSSFEIRAPFAGTIYSLPITEHDYVNTGTELLNLADLSRVQVRAFFDEPDVARLQLGQTARIVWDARPGKAWHGHITRLPTTIETSGTRHVGEAFLSVDDAYGDLLPNTNVTVTVTTSQKMNVLVIPREALHTDGARNFVFVLEDGHLKSVNVAVGSTNLVRAEITAGLADGQQVVLNAAHNEELTPGAAARIAP